jgi:hypothetical protein
MPEIELDDELYRRLFRFSRGFEDTATDVIRRILDQIAGTDQEGAHVSLSSTDRRYIRRGERTPQQAFQVPILLALDGLGGSGSTQHVVDVVGRNMEGTLTSADLLAVPTGETRWRNTVRWARQHLVNDGFLDPSAPHGTWRLSDDGRREVARLRKNGQPD